MIVEGLLAVVAGIVVGVLGVMPSLAVPGWLTSMDSTVNTAIGYVSDMGYWLPIPLMVSVTAAVLGCVAVGFGIKCARIVLSFLTAGGGSAA